MEGHKYLLPFFHRTLQLLPSNNNSVSRPFEQSVNSEGSNVQNLFYKQKQPITKVYNKYLLSPLPI